MRRELSCRYQDLDVEIVPIRTSGDRGERERLGAFVREIQEALLGGVVDVALHCLKDLPTTTVPGLCLPAHLLREDPRDTLISKGASLFELPEGAIVGTGSVRRTSQLAAVRPDLNFRPLVGNIDTRLRKLMEEEYDAIVLAVAGLSRLGLLSRWDDSEYAGLVVEPFDAEQMLPAPGQAVLVLETRATDADSSARVGILNDPATEACAIAERAFLQTFGGGCSVPVAALATSDVDTNPPSSCDPMHVRVGGGGVGGCRSDQVVTGPFDGWSAGDGDGTNHPSATDQAASSRTLTLRALVASPDGARVLRGNASGRAADAERVGRELGALMGADGAFEIVRAALRDREAVR